LVCGLTAVLHVGVLQDAEPITQASHSLRHLQDVDDSPGSSCHTLEGMEGGPQLEAISRQSQLMVGNDAEDLTEFAIDIVNLWLLWSQRST